MKRTAINAAIVLTSLAGLYLLWQMRKAAALFLLSLGVAAALRPTVRRLTSRGAPTWLAIAIAYLVALSVPAALLLLAGPTVIAEMRTVTEDVARGYDEISGGWMREAAWRQTVVARLPTPEQLYQALVGETGGSLLSAILGATFSAFGVAIDFVLMIFLSIYWSIDRVHFERLWFSLLSVERRARTRELWRAIEPKIGAYVRSEAIQSVAAGLILWLGYVALGQPYPTLLAAIGAAAWLIPWLGATIAVAAVALFSLPVLAVEGGGYFLTVTVPAACYTFAVLLMLELVVEPRLFNRRSYNALGTAIVAIAMAEVWGVVGLLLGPPVSVILQIAAWQWIHPQPSAEFAAKAPAAFEQRFQAIREALDRSDSPRPDLLSFVERLEKLVALARGSAPLAVEFTAATDGPRQPD